MSAERNDEPSVLPIALSMAIGVHVALGMLAPSHAEATSAPAVPLEVELAPPRPEPPPAPPKSEPEPDPAPVRPAPAARNTPARAPAPRAAGKLLTAEASAADSDAPLDFVTDPNGTSYGFGVVSRGGAGTGEGTKGPVAGTTATPAVAVPKAAPALTPSEDLSEKPRLLAEDPCRGYYPRAASVDSASAVVRVVLEASGQVRNIDLLSETPPGEGFGNAARLCLKQQRFSSARDRTGRAVATATTIRVRFER